MRNSSRRLLGAGLLSRLAKIQGYIDFEVHRAYLAYKDGEHIPSDSSALNHILAQFLGVELNQSIGNNSYLQRYNSLKMRVDSSSSNAIHTAIHNDETSNLDQSTVTE